MAKITTSTNIDWVQVQEQGSNPATPASGYGRVFCKSDGLYFIDDAGVVTGPLVSAAGGGYTQGARVYHNANQAVNAVATTTLAFNSEIYDTDIIHDTVTNNERLTCKTAGKYVISVQLVFNVSSTNFDNAIWIEHQTRGRVAQTGWSGLSCITLSTIIDLAVNDYLVVKVYNAQTNSNVIYAAGNEYSPFFEMQRIG